MTWRGNDFKVGDLVETTVLWVIELEGRDVTLEPGDVGLVLTSRNYGISVHMFRTGIEAWVYMTDFSEWRRVGA